MLNAFEVKEILDQYTDEELQAMTVRVYCHMDYEEGDLAIADDFEINGYELVINI